MAASQKTLMHLRKVCPLTQSYHRARLSVVLANLLL